MAARLGLRSTVKLVFPLPFQSVSLALSLMVKNASAKLPRFAHTVGNGDTVFPLPHFICLETFS